ncbi:MAG TPA: alginate lyase family protein [Vicinamibacterales bacterium]
MAGLVPIGDACSRGAGRAGGAEGGATPGPNRGLMMRLDRLRRLTRAELAWRSTARVRIAARRLETRLRQPRWKRADVQRVLAEHVSDPLLRRAVAAADWMAVHDALAEAIRTRPTRFVLDPSTLDDVRHAVSDRWPSAASAAAERADRILAGHYDLLGYRGLSFARPGGGVDWHLDPVHNRRGPAAFWAGVRYLDPAVGDHKIIWELNRHQHWLQLGRALWLTRDGRYGDEIVNQLQSWLAANPPLVGINWASMLELGFRAMSWTWALHFLIGGVRPLTRQQGAAVPWIVDLLVALDRQMTHVEENLSYYFSPNTHLTGEALALYVVGSALPELAASGRWSDTGRRILLTEINRQIQADGGHVERSTHYQRYTLDFYLLAWVTAERAQDRDAIAIFREAVTRLAAFTRTMADDRGCLPLIGDDDGGMLWPLAGRACDDVRDSLALAAVALGRPELAPWGVPEETFWVGGRLAIDRAPLVETHASAVATTSRTLPETGYVVMRDGDGGHAVFDAGPHGYLNGGHAHADALAMTLTLRNRPFLVDPGTSTYTMDTRLRDLLRSSRSHNTVTLDDRSQAVSGGPFDWRSRADGRLHAWRHNAAFDWAAGSHDGYAPLRHTRAVLRTLDYGWLIVDDVEGDGRHAAAAYWHFDPGWMVARDAPGRLRATHLEGERAWLLYDGGDAWLAHGDEETGQGWFAPVYGTLVPAWTARITRDETVPFAAVTWLAAANTGSEPPPVLERIAAQCEAGGRAIAARVARDGRVSTFMLRLEEPASRDTRASGVGDYQTNARVLHCTEHRDGTFVLDLVDASHACALHARRVSTAASEPVADLHVAFEDDVLDVRSSHPPSQLRVEGAILRRVTVVRVNGRDRAPDRDGTDAIVIGGADWGAAQIPELASLAPSA